jgi:hypothetical protein
VEGDPTVKTTVELTVRLKVMDLVTQTAWMTFTEKLGFAGTLRGMVHYWYWGMEAEGKDRETIVNEVGRVIRVDSAFTNQNKHRYRLRAGGEAMQGDLDLDGDYPVMDGHAVPSGTEGLIVFDCLVRERRPAREIGFAERLNSRLQDVAVASLVYGELWRLLVKAPTGDAALEQVERMLVSRSRREGLLLNPHYQRYRIMAVKSFGAPWAPPPSARMEG